MSQSDPIPKKHMEAVDSLYKNPEERATEVYNQLRAWFEENEDKAFPDWDLLCFAISYIGQQALVIEDEDFLEAALWINRWLYAVHYSNPGRLYGEPDKAVQTETTKEAQSEADRGD